MKIPPLQNWDQALQFLNDFLDFPLQEQQTEQLLKFYEILLDNNQVMNLTKLSSLPDFLTFHLADTATVLYTLQKNKINNFKSYLDLGSGCGVPGIVFHILAATQSENLITTLCDSRTKRAEYLQRAIEILHLNHTIKVTSERAEKMNENKTNKKAFNLVTARAFAKPPETLMTALPFLSEEGIFIYQTSLSQKDEQSYVNTLKRHKAEIIDEKHFEIDGKPRYVGLVTRMW